MKAICNLVTFLAAAIILAWAGFQVYLHWDVIKTGQFPKHHHMKMEKHKDAAKSCNCKDCKCCDACKNKASCDCKDCKCCPNCPGRKSQKEEPKASTQKELSLISRYENGELDWEQLSD